MRTACSRSSGLPATWIPPRPWRSASLHVFTGRNFVVMVRHAETAGVGRVRRRLEDRPDLLRHGPESVLSALLDMVVDDYAPVVAALENDIDEIEDQLFGGDNSVSPPDL